MKKRRLGLVGYYGRGNYGDELFRDVLALQLPDFHLEVLDVVRLSSDADYLSHFQTEIDAVLIGGGDLVIPYAWAAWYFADSLLTKPLFISGVGVPTWGGVDAAVVDRLRGFFRQPAIRFIGVRDIESRDWIEQNLAPHVPVQYFPDMVCALPLPEAAKPAQPILTLITRHQKRGEIQWRNILALCEKAHLLGYRVRNLILGFGAIGEDDMAILAAEVPDGPWEILRRPDSQALTAAIAQSTVVASMKFHGCIVAAMYGIPAIGLITTDKFGNFFRAIERPELIAHHSYPDLAERLPKTPVPIPRATVDRLRSRAEHGLQALRDSLRQTVP